MPFLGYFSLNHNTRDIRNKPVCSFFTSNPCKAVPMLPSLCSSANAFIVVVTSSLQNLAPTIGFNNIFIFDIFSTKLCFSQKMEISTVATTKQLFRSPKSTKIYNNKNLIGFQIGILAAEVSQESFFAFTC